MSSLTLITGTIDEAEDPFNRLDASELYYETWESDPISPKKLIVTREPIPIKFYNRDVFRIVQYLGSGKTLEAIRILSEKAYHGGTVAANLSLTWHNEGKPKNKWEAAINSMEDFKDLNNCTLLLDDIKSTILRWNVKEADIVSEIANAGRKTGLDLIITAQREKMIPPEIRDIATAWIVPIIRVRDRSRPTPDGTGYPMEMIALHFDGVKILRFISEPVINLEPLFNAYSTLQKAISLKNGSTSSKAPRQGLEGEVKLHEYLKLHYPDIDFKLLNGKGIFDIECHLALFDHVGVDDKGCLIIDHKNILKHKDYCARKCTPGYLVFWHKNDYKFISVNSKHLLRSRPAITTGLLSASRSRLAVLG